MYFENGSGVQMLGLSNLTLLKHQPSIFFKGTRVINTIITDIHKNYLYRQGASARRQRRLTVS